MEELMETLGYLFQRSGKDVISEKDLVLSISMDLGWFSPDEAKQLIDVGIELKLLRREDHGLKPCFNYRALSIPIDFTPTKNILQLDSQEPLLLLIVRSIDEKTALGRNNIMSEINKKQNLLDVEIEVAAILVAKKYEIDISGFIKEAEVKLFAGTDGESG
jgi:hypothetical protein